MAVATSDQSLRQLVDAIVANDGALFSKLIDGSSPLATASFAQGATRQGASPSPCFIKEIGHYIYAGDTALHFAAASYRHYPHAGVDPDARSACGAWHRAYPLGDGVAPAGRWWMSFSVEITRNDPAPSQPDTVVGIGSGYHVVGGALDR